MLTDTKNLGVFVKALINHRDKRLGYFTTAGGWDPNHSSGRPRPAACITLRDRHTVLGKIDGVVGCSRLREESGAHY